MSRNIKRLREERRLTFVELSERLAGLEPPRPIPVLGLRRIEREERRVDVDDLFAFAEIFKVSPTSLVYDKDPGAEKDDVLYQLAAGQILGEPVPWAVEKIFNRHLLPDNRLIDLGKLSSTKAAQAVRQQTINRLTKPEDPAEGDER